MDTGEADLPVRLPANEVDAPKRASIEDVLRVRPIYTLQGPPGTGKSHTITAIMLSAIFLNKKVLLVSQKKAAINVVRDKLNVFRNRTLKLRLIEPRFEIILHSADEGEFDL